MPEKEPFDRWQDWANKPRGSLLMIPAKIYDAVIALQPDERNDRDKVNAAVQYGVTIEIRQTYPYIKRAEQ